MCACIKCPVMSKHSDIVESKYTRIVGKALSRLMASNFVLYVRSLTRHFCTNILVDFRLKRFAPNRLEFESRRIYGLIYSIIISIMFVTVRNIFDNAKHVYRLRDIS